LCTNSFWLKVINPLSIDLVTARSTSFFTKIKFHAPFPYSIDSCWCVPTSMPRWAILYFFGLKLQQLHGLLLKYQYALPCLIIFSSSKFITQFIFVKTLYSLNIKKVHILFLGTSFTRQIHIWNNIQLLLCP
jgi:hypothetical protein